jgi:hypothetical protein
MMKSHCIGALVLGIIAHAAPAWAQSRPQNAPIEGVSVFTMQVPEVIGPPAATPYQPLANTKDCGTAGCKKCQFMVFGDALYWNVHGGDVPFGQTFNGIDPLTAVPNGPVGVANPTYQPGFRIGAGVSVGDHGWLVGTFTWFRDVTDDSITATNGNVIRSSLTAPNTLNSAPDSLTASAHSSIQLYEGDLDYKCCIVNGDHVSLNWLAGARYAHLGQTLDATYKIFGTTTVDTQVNFDGAGPRAGLEGEYRIACGLYGYGKGILDLLAGHFSGSYSQHNIFAGNQASTQISEDRLVPQLEFELGVGWVSPKGRVRVSAGYYVGTWFNTITIPGLIQGVQNNNFTTNSNNFRDTLTFDGLVGHVEFRY